jgi:hypothetical protein
MVKYELNHVKLTDTQFKLIIGDIVDSDPLTNFDADPDPRYADVGLETDVPPPE